MFEKEDLPDILGDIHVNLAFNPEQWSKILEQLLLVVLILGRWLLPKGKMSRDQFSQLMLGREIPFFRYKLIERSISVHRHGSRYCGDIRSVPREQGDDKPAADLRHPSGVELEPAAVLPRYRSQPQVAQDTKRVTLS